MKKGEMETRIAPVQIRCNTEAQIDVVWWELGRGCSTLHSSVVTPLGAGLKLNLNRRWPQ